MYPKLKYHVVTLVQRLAAIICRHKSVKVRFVKTLLERKFCSLLFENTPGHDSCLRP